MMARFSLDGLVERMCIDSDLREIFADQNESSVEVPDLAVIEFVTFASSGSRAVAPNTAEAMRQCIDKANMKLLLPEQYIGMLAMEKHRERAHGHIFSRFYFDMTEIQRRPYVLIPVPLKTPYSRRFLKHYLDENHRSRLIATDDSGLLGYGGIVNVPAYW